MTTKELLDYRLAALDEENGELKTSYEKLEARVRALELAWAKIVGMSAGGALVGGALVQLFQYLAGK